MSKLLTLRSDKDQIIDMLFSVAHKLCEGRIDFGKMRDLALHFEAMKAKPKLDVSCSVGTDYRGTVITIIVAE